MTFIVKESFASFGGKMLMLTHESKITNSKMTLNLYLPHQYFDAELKDPLPVLLFLSGLNSTPDNISEKAYVQPSANKYGFAVILPDTSPRLDDKQFEDGMGAGMYVDATEKPWNKYFKMYSYILKDLLPSIREEYSKLNLDRMSICGHSMGGMGALIIYLRNPNLFRSCSAFAPLTHPIGIPNGKMYFKRYLGEDETQWVKYDPSCLIKHYDGPKRPILIFQGTKDKVKTDLMPEYFLEASKGTKLDGLIQLKYAEGYDHAYYFVSTYVPEHCEFHAKYLGLL